MKRKMTFFAFGAKCGGLGSMGSMALAEAGRIPARASAFISDIRAMPPRLRPQAPRNWRRVCWRSELIGRCIWVLLTGYKFIEVQQRARYRCPGGKLVGFHARRTRI